MTREERNRRIVAEARAGATQRELAAKYGLTTRMIAIINTSQGYRLDQREASRKASKTGGGYPIRLKASDWGRYRYLRTEHGAAKAREMMGISR